MPLEPELLEAYQRADYVVIAEPELVLKIGQASADLDALLDAYDVSTAAFITAANPHSDPQSDEENDAASERLHIAAMLADFDSLPGEGRDPWHRWPREPSWLILGVSREQAQAFGEEFEQNAIVFCEKGRPPELVVLAD